MLRYRHQVKELAGIGRTSLELPLNEAGSLMLKIPAGAFSQVNWRINLDLIKEVNQQVAPSEETQVVDLYAGAGNFSLPLARAGAQVIAVECDPRLIRCGRQSAERNGLGRNIEFVETSVEKYLRKNLLPENAVILADPPRSGLGPLTGEMGEASKILFIACHLPSFIRDTKQLSQKGWKLTYIQPFDMFAQTSYVEVLGVLERDI